MKIGPHLLLPPPAPAPHTTPPVAAPARADRSLPDRRAFRADTEESADRTGGGRTRPGSDAGTGAGSRLAAVPAERRGASEGTAPHRPAAPLMAQMIAQEVIGAGLHIEPWRQAMAAYGRASAVAA